MATLTEQQRRALAYLAQRDWATPAGIGNELLASRKPMTHARGAALIGGAMGARLVKRRLAMKVSFLRGGRSVFAITDAGRAALKEAASSRR